jgi:hypothetical protein
VDEIVERLKKRGAKIEYNFDYTGPPEKRVRHELEEITHILVPLSSKEWCEMCMREGRFYMGSCCGQTGYIQDILNEIFRDGGSVDSLKAFELVDRAEAHEGFDLLREKNEMVLLDAEENWKDLDPVAKLTLCVGAVLPKMQDKLRGLRKLDPADPMDAIGILQSGSQYIHFKDIFVGDDATEARKGQAHGNTAARIARMVPAAKTFLTHAAKVADLPFEGFAVVDEKNEIAENRMGLTIYTKEKYAKELLDLWKKDRESKKLAEKFVVKPVRVTIEKGIELL